MGLNLETLIGILFILILVIIGDGVRRILKDRGSLKMRIDPTFRDAGDAPAEQHNPELPSAARVINRGDPVPMGNLDGLDDEDEVTPPLIMEQEQPRAPVKATQQDLFGESAADQQDTDAVVAPARSAPVRRDPVQSESPRTEPPRNFPHRSDPHRSDLHSSAQAAPPPAEPPAQRRPESGQSVVEVIVVHMASLPGQRLDGRDLLQTLLEQGMRFGEMNIFHCHANTAQGMKLQFSMANAMEPGTFDIDEMEKQQFRGVTFFLKLPGPAEPMMALDRMLSVCRTLADRLGGELYDEQRSVLTQQTMEHLRQRVQDFNRRQRVPGG